jgi:hypothetical protein
MATAAIDFTEQKQTEVEPNKHLPCENELSTMEDFGEILKPYFDAQENLDKAESSFAAQFNGAMALQIVTFRDAYWTPKSHATVAINDADGKPVAMTWDDFVTTYLKVTRRWLNKILKRYLEPATATSDDDTEDVDIDEDDNNGDSKAEILKYVKGLDEDEAASLLGQINDDFSTDEDEDDEETQGQVEAAGDELDEVVPLFKRISLNSVSVFARKLELLAEKLGFDEHIRIVVE